MTSSSEPSNSSGNATDAIIAASTTSGAALSWLGTIFRVLRAGLIVGAASFIAGSALLYVYQREIIYPASFPPGSRQRVPRPNEFNMEDFDDVTLETPDGFNIKLFVIQGRSEKPTNSGGQGAEDGTTVRQRRRVTSSSSTTSNTSSSDGRDTSTDPSDWNPYTLVYFHANAGNMGHRLPIAYWLWRRFGCNIVMLDYRGYGFSNGKPSEEGIRTDVKTTMEYVRKHPCLKDTKLVFYGQSIGGAVTIDAAAQPENHENLVGVIVENTFLSLTKLVPEVMPIIGTFRLSWLLKDTWNSERSVSRIPGTVPMLFLSGAKDELIRPHNMHQLYHTARARTDVVENTWWFSFADGTHNDTVVMPGYVDRIEEFWNAMVSKKVAPPPRTVLEAQERVVEGEKEGGSVWEAARAEFGEEKVAEEVAFDTVGGKKEL